MEKISIAKVLKPQGLKGELKCKALTERINVFSKLKSIICDNKSYDIISGVYRLGFVYISLENVSTIEQAEKFRNKTLYITKDEFGSLEPDNYFIDDLIGIKVFNTDGQEIGEIIGTEFYGASDILLIKEKFATYSISFLKEIFLKVDIKGKRAEINQKLYEENKIWKLTF